MPEFTLYYSPGACSRIVHILLEECEVPFSTHLVKRALGEHLTPEYLALNPKGKVPVLVIDGTPLTENVAIHTYLARTFPDAGLLPTGDLMVEVDVLSMLAWCASGLHPMITRMRRPEVFYDRDDDGLTRVREMAYTAMKPNFAIIEARLADRDWWFGDWSTIDVYLSWIWSRAEVSGFDGSPFPRYAAHYERILERPAVQRALAREDEAEASLAAQGLGVLPVSSPAA